jgi:exonuclease III
MRTATWNVRPLYTAGAVNELVKEINKYKADVCALQEIRWSGTGSVIKKYMILYNGHKSDKHESGIGFYISKHIMDYLLDFKTVNERMVKLGLNLNITIGYGYQHTPQLKKKMW